MHLLQICSRTLRYNQQMSSTNQTLNRNIKLAYLITVFEYSWFWIPIWVLYYLRFTNFAGFGFIESVLYVTVVLMEIPTGAIEDLIGKKKTIIASLFLGFLGNLIMGLAQSFSHLAIGVFIAGISVALMSGSFEAFIYDTLLSLGKKDRYEKVLGNISSLIMITLGTVSLVGGFLYSIYPGLPFILMAIMKLFAIVVCLFIVEPPIDSEKFSWINYKLQTKNGFK